MSYTIFMGNSDPSGVNAVFGLTENYTSFNIDLNSCDQTTKQICDDFFNLVGNNTTVNLINSPFNFQDVNFVVEQEILIDIVEVDYQSMNNNEKEIVNNFSNLLNNI